MRLQDRKLEGAVGVGLDLRRQGGPQRWTAPVEHDDGRVRREAGAGGGGHKAGWADWWVERERRLEARYLVDRVRFALPEIVGPHEVHTLGPTAHLDVEVEVTEDVGRPLEALGRPAGARIKGDEDRAVGIEVDPVDVDRIGHRGWRRRGRGSRRWPGGGARGTRLEGIGGQRDRGRRLEAPRRDGNGGGRCDGGGRRPALPGEERPVALMDFEA